MAPTERDAAKVRLLRSFDPALQAAGEPALPLDDLVGEPPSSARSRPDDSPLAPRPAPPEWDVPDPYYGGPQGFEQVLDLVEAACRGLVDSVRASLGRCPGGSGQDGPRWLWRLG